MTIKEAALQARVDQLEAGLMQSAVLLCVQETLIADARRELDSAGEMITGLRRQLLAQAMPADAAKFVAFTV